MVLMRDQNLKLKKTDFYGRPVFDKIEFGNNSKITVDD